MPLLVEPDRCQYAAELSVAGAVGPSLDRPLHLPAGWNLRRIGADRVEPTPRLGVGVRVADLADDRQGAVPVLSADERRQVVFQDRALVAEVVVVEVVVNRGAH